MHSRPPARATGCSISTRSRDSACAPAASSGCSAAANAPTRTPGASIPIAGTGPGRAWRPCYGCPSRIRGPMTLGWILAASVAGGTLSAGLAAVSLLVRASWVPILVSFAIGALLGAAFLEVIPHAFERGNAHAARRPDRHAHVAGAPSATRTRERRALPAPPRPPPQRGARPPQRPWWPPHPPPLPATPRGRHHGGGGDHRKGTSTLLTCSL